MTEEIIPTNGTSAEDVAYAKKVKEIYIDGVNVAGCEYFRESRCFDCGTQAICCQHPNCYYKQLKRLEQENKNLKVLLEVVNQKNIREGENTFNLVKYYRNENETLKDNNNRLQAIIDDGRAENKRFREENKELKIYVESNKQQVEEAEMLVMDNDRLQQEVENLKDTIYYDVENYRSALEEIKRICKCSKEPINCDECPQCDDCEELCVNDENLQDIILNKINEVLNLS